MNSYLQSKFLNNLKLELENLNINYYYEEKFKTDLCMIF